jgi:hypothetical protein
MVAGRCGYEYDLQVEQFGYGKAKPPHRFQAAGTEGYCFQRLPGQGALKANPAIPPPEYIARYPPRMWIPVPRDRRLGGGLDPTLDLPEFSSMRYTVSAPSLEVAREWSSGRSVHGDTVSLADTGDKQGRGKQRLAIVQLRNKLQVAPQLMEVDGATQVPLSSRSAFGRSRNMGPNQTTVSMPLVTGHVPPPGAKAGLPTWRLQAGK